MKFWNEIFDGAKFVGCCCFGCSIDLGKFAVEVLGFEKGACHT